jgi:hypothetical protein
MQLWHSRAKNRRSDGFSPASASTSASACASSGIATRAHSSRRSPAAVVRIGRALRSNSVTPNSDSSSRSWCDTADNVKCSRRAAWVKLPVSAMAAMVCRCRLSRITGAQASPKAEPASTARVLLKSLENVAIVGERRC